MNELEQIVQRMIDAGESEEAIALVIKEYNSEKVAEEGKTSTTETDTTVDVTEVSDTELPSADGSLELEETKAKKEKVYPGIIDIGDFFKDLYKAGEQGLEQAKAIDPSIDIYRAGSETSDEQIIKWIETNKNIAKNTEQSDEMQSFNKIYEENGGSWLGFVKGVAQNPSILPSVLVSSMATQIGSLQSEEVLAAGTAAGATGAAAGAFIGGVGALPGGLGGLMTGTMTAMETGLTFSELLTEEVGEDLNVDKVRKVLENPEKLAELKNKALGRGVAIGAIELATMGLAKGVGGKIAKAGFKGAKPTGLATAGAIEVTGSGTGEVAGRFVADQEMDVAEIGFEAFAGLGSAPITMASQLRDLGKNVDVANLNKFLKETNYKEVTEAFSPEVKTSEAQIKMAQTPNAIDIIDKKLKEEVVAGIKTVEEADAVALNFRETQGAVNQIKPLKLSTKDQATAVQLMKEKKQLSDEIKQVGEPNLTIEQSDRIKQIDEDLKGIGSKAVTQEVEKVKKAAESIKDLDVQEFASTEETEAFLNEQGQDPKASGQQGFIIQDPKTGKQTIVINREIADKEIAVAAPSHEFLHALLFQTVKDSPETQLALGNSLKEYINKIDANKVKDSNFAKRLEQYKSDPEAIQAEEVLTLFSDAIRTEDIKFNETVFTKIGDVVRKALQALGVKVKFNNGKDVYNFIKDYNKSLESTGLTKAQVKAAEGIKGKLVAEKVQTDEQIVKESRSEEASAKVQELYDTQGEAAAFDIIEQFKPITNKIVEKRSEAPNFDRQLLTDEIETGKRGILDLIKEYDPKSGVPLAAYINKFLPARAIEASRRILGEEFTEDVTEAKGVVAEEAVVEVVSTEKQATSKLRRVLGIKQDDDIYNLAKKVSEDILTSELPGKKVKTAINREARKSELRKAVSDLMGTEKAIDEQFLNKNILEILKALPASDLVKLEREAKVKVLAEQGPRLNVKEAREAVNKGLLPKDTNLQSGPKVSSKLPTTLEQAKEFFTQKRKAGLVNVITEMLVKDAAPEVTEGKMEPAKRAKVLSEIDREPTLKFSLSTKRDLDWSIDEAENRNTSFTIGDKTYNVQLNAKDLGADQDADPTDYSLEFDQDGSQELTGKGDQFKALSIIYNGLIDEIKSSPNIATISFNALASETSRVKLYDVLLDKLSKELGWTAEKFDYKSDGVVDEIGFEMYKPEETAKELPILKFSKSNLTKEQLNLVKQQQGEILQRFISSERSVKNMRLILSDVLKDAGISDENISKYAIELTPPAKKFIVDLKKQLVTESDFGEVTNEQIEQALSAITLKNLLGIDVNPGSAFDVPKSLNKFRKIQQEYQLEQIKKLGDLNGIISILKFHKDYHTSAGKIGDGRYQGYAGSLDWFKATNKVLKDKKIKIEYVTTGTGVVPVNVTINGVEQFKSQAELKAKIKTFSQSNNLKRKTVETEYSARKKEAGESFDAMVDYLNFVFKKGDKLQFGMSLMALKSNMSALGKRVAYVKYFYNGKSDSATVFEHMLPSLYTLKQMVENFYGKGVDLQALKESQQVAMIPRDMDKRINIVHQASMPSWFELGMSPLTRYFNALTKGYKNMFALESIGGKDKGVVYGKDHLALNNSVLKASKSNNDMLPSGLKLKGDFINSDVLNEMSEIDNTSKTVELKFSKSLDLNKDFNDIIENKTGIASDKTYARVKAEVAGANKGRFNFFIPPSAEDFVGLLYSTLGKGSTGDAQMAWYKAHLINPFARAMENIANDRVAIVQDYKGLKKALKIVPKDLRKKVPGEPFTREQAVRVYIWDQQGMEIPGLSKKDQSDLVKYVNDSAELTTFANQLIAINKGDEYASPDAGWVAGTIDTDFLKGLNTTKRAKYLEVWQQNVNEIFSETNLNKLEAAYGKPYRVAMENILHRMKTGRNRSFGTDTITGRFTDWLTNSVGAIMFFNTRSAVLQTISAVNFINFSDNNVLKAGQAFANQPQYWADFKKLFNSPFLLDRRSGVKLNVNEADIAEMAKGPGNSARNVIAGLLKAGFLPTQLADSFAIASGGATFYRNRIKALKKQGLTEAEAEEIAFRDFREIAEESQQSSRPDKISQQQAGPLGRVVLAFANTPAQYARLIKKAASDLKNGRGDAKTNISKIIYYGVAQNVLFSALQQALFAVSFGDEDEEEEKRNEKYFNIANGMADSILRGIGVGGAIASVVKNTAIKLAKEEEKRSPKYQDVLVKEVLQISPPISSKVGKLRSAGRSLSWNKKEMMTKGWSIDNPAYLASANVISAVTNVPADRAVKKITNLVDASNEEIEYYKRIALALGWSAWELDVDKKDKKKPESSTGETRTRRRTRTKKRRN